MCSLLYCNWIHLWVHKGVLRYQGWVSDRYIFVLPNLTLAPRNTYILPEIIFDPSLVLSPHIFLLGLLFTDCAFKWVNGEEVLVSIEQLSQLHIYNECNELQLPLNPTLDDIPVFRWIETTLQGNDISPEKPLLSIPPFCHGWGKWGWSLALDKLLAYIACVIELGRHWTVVICWSYRRVGAGQWLIN